MERRYTTILFDADNTLLDFSLSENRSIVKTLEYYGVEASSENVKTYVEINLALWKQLEKKEITKSELKQIRFKRFFDTIGFSFDGDTFEVNEHYLALLSECGYTISGAKELCEKLTDAGYKLYIVTNGIAKTQAKRLSKSGLLPYVSDVFVSEAVGFPKPDKRFFDYVLDRIDERDKSKVIVIGDSLSSDIKGACDSGLDSIWLNSNGAPSPDGFSATYTVTCLKELESILF